MKLTMVDLRNKFIEVIDKKVSFEEASEWAVHIIEKDELGQLELSCSDNVSKIFDCLTYLCGINTQISPEEYLYTIEDVKDKFNDLFS